MKKEKENKLSNCCKFSVKVVGGDEGTNHYECQKCHKGCDIYIEPTTKEKWIEEFDDETNK